MVKALLWVFLAIGPNLRDFEARWATAQKEYDLAAAQALLSEFRAALPTEPSQEERILLCRCLLLATELERVHFEEMRESSDRAGRRAVGKRIDELADEGIAQTTSLGETSEAFRMKSDFYALMIRTKYQGSKYHKDMEENANRALELDPQNAKAYVSVCKPYLFAKPSQGGDVQKAFDLLSKAVEIDPNLEIAQILLAAAVEKKGDKAKADEMRQSILATNPRCKLAVQTIQEAPEKIEQEAEDAPGP